MSARNFQQKPAVIQYESHSRHRRSCRATSCVHAAAFCRDAAGHRGDAALISNTIGSGFTIGGRSPRLREVGYYCWCAMSTSPCCTPRMNTSAFWHGRLALCRGRRHSHRVKGAGQTVGERPVSGDCVRHPNLIGTTGASMLLIRPWIRMTNTASPVSACSFIFLVSNVSGCLTPIGDPPLFLGFLKGVPFWWVAHRCWQAWLWESACCWRSSLCATRSTSAKRPNRFAKSGDCARDLAL